MTDLDRPGGRSERNAGGVILCLLSGLTVEQTAARTNISASTIYRLLRRPSFRRALTDAQARMFDTGLSVLQAGAVEAATVLRGALADDDARVRVRAAGLLLALAMKARAECGIAARVERIEEMIGLGGAG